MKYFLGSIVLILALIAIYLIAINFGLATDLNLLDASLAGVFKTSPITIQVGVGLLILICIALGKFFVLAVFLPLLNKNKEKNGAYERRLEKTSVANDESNAKVKVLENKIKVLEKALDDALKRNK